MNEKRKKYVLLKKHFVILQNNKMKLFENGIMEKYPESFVELSKIMKVLSHPIRLYVLIELSKMDSCCYSKDIAKEFNINPSTLTQHLKELKYAGLIQGEIESPYIKYCINRDNWNKTKELIKEFFEL